MPNISLGAFYGESTLTCTGFFPYGAVPGDGTFDVTENHNSPLFETRGRRMAAFLCRPEVKFQNRK